MKKNTLKFEKRKKKTKKTKIFQRTWKNKKNEKLKNCTLKFEKSEENWIFESLKEKSRIWLVKILLEKIFKNENKKLIVKWKFEVNNYKTKIEEKKWNYYCQWNKKNWN